MHLSIRVLGPLEIQLDGQPVTGLESDKVRALLIFLAVTMARPHRREKLAALLWPERPERSARGNLRRALANLRKALGDGDAAQPFLLVNRQTIQFNRDSDAWVDLNAIADLLSSRPRRPPNAPAGLQGIRQLENAVELYRGEFLEGFSLADSPAFDEWMMFQQEQIHRQTMDTLHDLGNWHEANGQLERALRCAWRQVELDPWRESGHRQVIRLLAFSGQRGAALAQYKVCCQMLNSELGVEPEEETVRLYEQIRDGELQRPTGVADVAPALAVAPRLPAFLAEEEQERYTAPVYVAYEHELARLDGLLQEAIGGQGQIVFVTGGPGRGKTALLAQFARRAMDTHPDLLVASGKCNAYAGVGDPYLPFRDVMAMLTGDVETKWQAGTIARDHARRLWAALPDTLQILVDRGPELVGTVLPARELVNRARAAAPGRALWLGRLEELAEQVEASHGRLEQSRLFEQYGNLLRDLAAQQPLLIVLDDLQWIDTASAGLLFHLTQRLAHEGCRILIGCAYRPEEVAPGQPVMQRGQPYLASTGLGERHPLEVVLAESRRRFGGMGVDLGRIEEAEGLRFVTALLDTQPNRLGDGFRAALFRQTEGHPLFTTELLRAMQERGDLLQDEGGNWIAGPVLDWQTLPGRVEAVIAERMGRLPRPTLRMLQIASVEGETFTAEVVARILSVDEREVLHCLGSLEREYRLVRACETRHVNDLRLSVYRFRHILFQKYLYCSLSAGERAYRHEDVGRALEELYGERNGEIAVPLARHFQEAGIVGKAITYLGQAGDQARGLYANDEAVDCYQQSLVLLKQCREHEQAARTLMKLGLTHHSALDFRQARRAYEEGFALWQQATQRQKVSPPSPPAAPHALRVDWNEPSTLDPTMAWDLYSACVIDQLFSGLVQFSPEMGVTPDVAVSWEVLEGGCKYVFHLRDDVRWSDGTAVTAGDFAYAWRRVLDPAANSANASLLYDITGARAFHQAEHSEQDALGIRAPDPVTLEVELERPTGYFPYLLAHHVSFPIPRHAVETGGDAWGGAGTLITNGPYRLESWQPGQALILARNDDYHGERAGNVLRIELSLLSECATQLKSYETGELDVFDLGSLPLPERDLVRHKHAGEYVSAPSLGTMYVGFDVSRPPFDDPEVRRALIFAAEREYLAGVVMEGYYFPATGGLIPPGMPGHSPEIGLPYDPERARDALAGARHPTGRDLAPADLLTFRSLEPYAEGLVAHWQKTLGIEIELQAVEYGQFVERMEQVPPRMFLSGWTADYPDPDNFLRVSPIQRYTRWQSGSYAQLVDAARLAGAQEERLDLYRRADGLLIREAVIMPLAYMRRHLLVKPWIKKLPMSPIKHWFWKDVVIVAH